MISKVKEVTKGHIKKPINCLLNVENRLKRLLFILEGFTLQKKKKKKILKIAQQYILLFRTKTGVL